MHLLLSLGTALSNLRTNKLRTALTMLGVIIGVSTVIVMVSIVEGARYAVVREFERLGSHLIIIAYQPDPQEQRGQLIDGLTMDDVRAVRSQCTLLERLSPELRPGQAMGRFREREMTVNAIGVLPDYLAMRNMTIDRGRGLTDEDADAWGKVCVIGSDVARKLFLKDDPIGRDLDLEGINLTVVGVLASKGRGSLGGGPQDDESVLLPITTLHKRIEGREVVALILAQPRDPAGLAAALDQVWQCLMRRHDNAPGIRVDSQENMLSSINRILSLFGLVLGSIAGLALLVGGIGIMNIMLVSVTERTREIGIRKAVGAKRRDILYQFLIESATVSGLGGLLGIGLGAAAGWGVGVISAQLMKGGDDGPPGIMIHLPLWAILGAFAFSAFVGVFFGIYPAIRAARLDPIEALRHE